MKTDMAKPDKLMVEAIRFWEFSRIYYNLVLLSIVIIFWGPAIIAGGPGDWIGASVLLAALALLANALFCLAYGAEFFHRQFAMGIPIARFRWIVLGAGMLVAVALELWIILRPGMG